MSFTRQCYSSEPAILLVCSGTVFFLGEGTVQASWQPNGSGRFLFCPSIAISGRRSNDGEHSFKPILHIMCKQFPAACRSLDRTHKARHLAAPNWYGACLEMLGTASHGSCEVGDKCNEDHVHYVNCVVFSWCERRLWAGYGRRFSVEQPAGCY
jgi:hypothetical protein